MTRRALSLRALSLILDSVEALNFRESRSVWEFQKAEALTWTQKSGALEVRTPITGPPIHEKQPYSHFSPSLVAAVLMLKNDVDGTCIVPSSLAPTRKQSAASNARHRQRRLQTAPTSCGRMLPVSLSMQSASPTATLRFAFCVFYSLNPTCAGGKLEFLSFAGFGETAAEPPAM